MKYTVPSIPKLLIPGLACLASLLFAPSLSAQAVLTWHNDAARTGQNLQETLLSPSNVNSSSFGELPFSPLNTGGSRVDAQPLYVPGLMISGVAHNVLFVATENDTLYAFDADTGAEVWTHLSLLRSGETASDDRGCSSITPTIGITSTPVIDLAKGPNGTIFVVAMSKDGSSNYFQRLHAIDITTGIEESNWPITIAATYPGNGPNSLNGILTFDSKQYMERAALAISNGVIYTTWASHCDSDPYNGWIIGYNESSQAQVVLNLTPNGTSPQRGAIWMAGAGPAVDAGGNLYLLMGNGTFDTTLNANGFPSEGDYGNAFLNLSTTSGLAVADYFGIDTTVAESSSDTDLGSGGGMLLPVLNDAMGNPHELAVGAGKDGNAYVVDRNNMGKFNPANNSAVYQLFALDNAVFSSPAWFNNTLYYGPIGSPVTAYPYSGGSFNTSSPPATSQSFGVNCPNTGATPSISANGLTGGILWVSDTTCDTSPQQVHQPAVLYAYDASTLAYLYDSTQNTGSNFGVGITFPTATTANGKVYVGTATGVGAFGLLNCTYFATPSGGVNVDSGAHSGGVSVPASPSTCSWSATTTSNFITITGGASGTGPGSVSYSIPANPGTQRTGTIIVAGHTFTITQAGNTTTAGLGFYPLNPCRVVDTRSGPGGSGPSGPFGTPSLAPDSTRDFPIPNSFCNAPASAAAYSMNMTVVVPSGDGLGYLTSWGAGQALPPVATLNAPNGGIVGNAAIVQAGVDQAISVFATNQTNLVIDINGYFGPPNSPQALAFYPVTPCRVADTRSGGGAFGQPSLVAGTSRDFPVQQSACGIPSGALAYSMRLTAVPPGRLGYLTAYPAGGTLPIAATLNDPSGGVVGNETIVPAGAENSGAISVYATDNTDLVIDINGYFALPGSPGALFFYPLTPCRVADTRFGSGFGDGLGQPSLAGGATRDFPMRASACGIPSTAQAYSLNMTAVVPSGGRLGYLTAFPTGESVPVAATVNALSGVVGSAAIVPANTSTGDISVYANGNTDLVIDINGYFAP